MDTENATNASCSFIKVEQNVDDFEFVNVPFINMPQDSYLRECTESIKGEPKLLENPKVILENETISENPHQIPKTAINQHEAPFSTQEISVKIESNEELNDFGELHDTVFVDFPIKNEILELKQENLEKNETGISSITTQTHTGTIDKCQQYLNQSRQGNLKGCQQTCAKHSQIFPYDRSEYQNSQKNYLTTHLQRHKNPEEVHVFKCDQCEFQTIYKYNLNTHLLRHKNPEEVHMLKCDQCDFQTIQKSCLKRHLLRHINPEEVHMLKCDQCDFQTIHKRYLKTHLLRHKNPEEVNMFKCDQCEFQTVHKCNLKTHLLRHKDPEEVNIFKCDQCHYQCNQKWYLNRHLLRHKNPGEVHMLKCDQCDFQTIQKRYLKAHYLRHKNKEEIV